jgi:hypothetical protein
MRIDPYGGTQSEPKQGFVLFESTPVDEISLVDYYLGDFEQVLHRPIETTPVTGDCPLGITGQLPI